MGDFEKLLFVIGFGTELFLIFDPETFTNLFNLFSCQ